MQERERGWLNLFVLRMYVASYHCRRSIQSSREVYQSIPSIMSKSICFSPPIQEQSVKIVSSHEYVYEIILPNSL